METKPVFYDDKCLACHAPKGASAKTLAAKNLLRPCPVGTKNCSTCHMPKVALPGAHLDFTDHRIRIVKPGEPFPH
jgi:mono/diheme cytochrome c family protein